MDDIDDIIAASLAKGDEMYILNMNFTIYINEECSAVCKGCSSLTVGGDVDEGDCNMSDGFLFCQEKQECINDTTETCNTPAGFLLGATDFIGHGHLDLDLD